MHIMFDMGQATMQRAFVSAMSAFGIYSITPLDNRHHRATRSGHERELSQQLPLMLTLPSLRV